jgi:hypothetical protein
MRDDVVADTLVETLSTHDKRTMKLSDLGNAFVRAKGMKVTEFTSTGMKNIIAARPHLFTTHNWSAINATVGLKSFGAKAEKIRSYTRDPNASSKYLRVKYFDIETLHENEISAMLQCITHYEKRIREF